MVKVLADAQIPYLETWLKRPDIELIQVDANKIAQDLAQHKPDALVVRTVTTINSDLMGVLPNLPTFIATASAGADHLDTAWLEHRGIAWAAAPGCNKEAVVQYVESAIALLAPEGPLKIGVIGVGHVGSLLTQRCTEAGHTLILNDPLRHDIQHTQLTDSVWQTCDVISVHTSLTHSGPSPSFKLLDKTFFKTLKHDCVLINTARGEVLNEADLLTHGKHLKKVIDVWTNEPNINVHLLKHAQITTPHIAGYSKAAKYNASQSIAKHILKHFNLDNKQPTHRVSTITDGKATPNRLQEESNAMQAGILQSRHIAETFNQLRKTYLLR